MATEDKITTTRCLREKFVSSTKYHDTVLDILHPRGIPPRNEIHD